MDSKSLDDFIEQAWQVDVLPALLDYMAIPCESPAFDPDWDVHGHLQLAAQLMRDWAREHLRDVPGASVDIVRVPGRTPLVFIDIPGEAGAPVLVYGHLDKQPAMEGWTHGREAWSPMLEGDRLYGRGGADDGYAIFAAITAALALRAQGAACARCVILIEGCEESGSAGLDEYIEYLAPRIGVPSVVVALDAGCGNYEQLWLTTSVRGQVAGTLDVRVLEEGVHSGDASGVVPSSFRIARQLLSRLEDPATGDVVSAFHVPIPDERRRQAAAAVTTIGADYYAQLPLRAGVQPVSDDLPTLALNRSWRPQLAITGFDGLPSVANAAAVMQPATRLKLSLRLPPVLDPQAAAQHLKALIESDPPYGSEVCFTVDMTSPGWNAPRMAPWLEASLERASLGAFAKPMAMLGGGGGIPFLSMLGERFPHAQFVVTGVLGPKSNAHGPNEFLHIPTAKRITTVMAHLLHDAAREFRDNGAGESPRRRFALASFR
ncbi:M20/M25/M40 family metallo-hydrolase [Lysobacter tyrosinilyticus]